MEAYDKLMEKYKEIVLIGTTEMMLSWDLETYMPPGGIGLRSDQLGLLKRLSHRMLVSDEVGRLMAECERDKASMDELRSRNLHLFKKDRDVAMSVPEDLVAAHEKQAAITRDAWAKARNAKDWRIYEPELKKMVDLSVQVAEATKEAKGAKTAFDSMIDDYERGMTEGQASEMLTTLRSSLVPLVDRFSDAWDAEDEARLRRFVPIEARKEVTKEVVNLLGFDTVSDKARGRIDETIHPFTTGHIDDVRITLRYKDDELFESLLGAMHETGHALYDQNMEHDWMYLPVTSPGSMGLHESCSRFCENMIGTSREFWGSYLPRFKQLTGTAYADLGLDDLMRSVNRVERSKIRVKADEVTYCLHIAIRFEIERALFSGKVKVEELPHMWNDLYDRYLHVKMEDDVEGVMQDIHWSMGAFGYFQSYALGNVYDGMYLKRLEKDMPSWRQEVSAGNPRAVLGWFREKIHRWGAFYDPADLVQRITCEPLSSQPFVEYLERKYEAIWC